MAISTKYLIEVFYIFFSYLIFDFTALKNVTLAAEWLQEKYLVILPNHQFCSLEWFIQYGLNIIAVKAHSLLFNLFATVSFYIQNNIKRPKAASNRAKNTTKCFMVQGLSEMSIYRPWSFYWKLFV